MEYTVVSGIVSLTAQDEGWSLVPPRSGALNTREADPGIAKMLGLDAGVLMPHAQAGKLRALAVTSAQPSAMAPDLPTVSSSGLPGYEVTSWNGMLIPAGTPPAIKAKLQAWFGEILAMPETRQYFATMGTDVFVSTPQETADLLAREILTWGQYVKTAKIEPQ